MFRTILKSLKVFYPSLSFFVKNNYLDGWVENSMKIINFFNPSLKQLKTVHKTAKVSSYPKKKRGLKLPYVCRSKGTLCNCQIKELCLSEMILSQYVILKTTCWNYLVFSQYTIFVPARHLPPTPSIRATPPLIFVSIDSKDLNVKKWGQGKTNLVNK